MKEFRDKIAVITGGASGIGRGLAERLAEEGAKVVLADVETKALRDTERKIRAGGAKVLAVKTDVSRFRDVERLARKTLEEFGAVHLLFNNAGVGGGASVWESTLADWEWMMGVNLWGVIHGIKAFVPIMLEQDTECHITNTSSMAALMSYPGRGIYKVTKTAVLSLTETLYHELAWRNSKIGVSVLLPGNVKTRIMDCARNRPARLQNDSSIELDPKFLELDSIVRQAVDAGLPPREFADRALQGIREGKLYIITHPEMIPMAQVRMEDISTQRNPAARL